VKKNRAGGEIRVERVDALGLDCVLEFPIAMNARSSVVVFFSIVATLAYVGCNPVKGMTAADQAVKDFHSKLDAADFKGIYDAAHADFKDASTEKDFTAILEAVHRKLGNVQSSERVSWNINSYNLKTNVESSCKTKFADGEATESFIHRLEGDRAVLYGYNINSTELITK
jgi:hypothetical protein